MNNGKKFASLAIAISIAIGISALLAAIEPDDFTELVKENHLGG